MIEYVVNEDKAIKAKDFESLMNKCDKRDIVIDNVTVDGILVAERLRESTCESIGSKVELKS